MKMNLDPRPYAIDTRLSGIGKIIAVSGFKGGVGKSSVACLLSLASSDSGMKTGLLDLDFSGASCHLILGADLGHGAAFPEEVEGLKPPEIHGIKLMSLAFFTQNRAVHLRGRATTDTVTELLSVTNWGNLDILFLDMPPGISDVALDVMRLIPRIEIIGVLTPSVLSRDLALKALRFSEQSGVKIIGIVENLFTGTNKNSGGFPCLATLPYDAGFESALGNIDRLRQTDVYNGLRKVVI